MEERPTVNRLLKSLVLFLAVAFLSCWHAEAQNCGPWLGVTSWNVTYTISGTGSGPDQAGYVWTTSHQVNGNSVLTTPQTKCAAQLNWTGQADGTGSINDIGVQSCSSGGQTSISIVGGGSSFNDQATLTILTINTTNGTYTFSPLLVVSDTITENSCGTINTQNAASPANPFAVGCGPTYGATFLLPQAVSTITETNLTFSAPADCVTPGGAPTNWTLSYTLTPVVANNNPNVDHPCPPDAPVGSSIACQNQSLREDVPIVGTGFFLHYESDRAPGAGASTIATTDAGMIGGWTLSVHHAYDPSSNTLFLGDGSQRSAWQLAGSLPYNGGTLVTSEDGNEIYSFDVNGRHLETLKPLTGAVKYQFAYDSAGNLFTVTDGSGNITTVERDGSEHATAIVSPYAQSTNLAMDSNGFLSALSDPKGNLLSFANTSTGLLQSRTDANGNLFSYAYDSQGRLTSDSDAVGGSTALNRTDSSSGYSVTTTTAMGRTATFQVTTPSSPGEQFTNTWPNGLQATATNTQQTGQLSENASLPDGTLDVKTFVPDQRWGLQAQVLHSRTLTLGGLTMTVSGSRTASLGTAGNPFSLTGQTDIKTVNGRTYKTVFTAANLTSVATTPVKRTTTTVFDSLERISSKQVGTLLPVKFAYDGHGRISTVTQGTRIATLAYDASGLLSSITDPLKLTSSFTHDGDGHLLDRKSVV
jgi:YD repeat-containing protein